MSRAVEALLRPSLMALAIGLAAPLASPALFATEQSAPRTYNLPSAPLANTLNQIASQAGIALALDPALVSGRASAPVSSQYNGVGALQAALRGTGLQLLQSGAGTYSLVAAPDDSLVLPETSVNAASDSESAWGPVEGYVAKRTAAGTKTNTALVEVPCSISVATRQQMSDRGVHSLDDAVRYMPGIVSASYGSDTRYDWMRVRGFEPTQSRWPATAARHLRQPEGRDLEPGPPCTAAWPGLLDLWPDPARRPAGHGQPSPTGRKRP